MIDDPTKYDFVRLGEGLAHNLLHAAEDQVARAQTMLDQTKSLAEILLKEIRAQAAQIEEMTQRFTAFGEQMLEAHRTLNGHGQETAPLNPDTLLGEIIHDDEREQKELEKLRTLGAAYGKRSSTLPRREGGDAD